MHHPLRLPTQSPPKIEAARGARAVASIKWYSHIIPWSPVFRSFSVYDTGLPCLIVSNSHWSFEVNVTKGQHWFSDVLPSCPHLPAYALCDHCMDRSLSLKAHYIALLLLIICENSQCAGQRPSQTCSQLLETECFPALQSLLFYFSRWKTSNVIIYFPCIVKFLVPEICI